MASCICCIPWGSIFILCGEKIFESVGNKLLPGRLMVVIFIVLWQNIAMVKYKKLRGKSFQIISNTLLQSAHNCTVEEYVEKFGGNDCAFSIIPNRLAKSDPRYKRWHESLKRRPVSWSKGYTKYTHPGVAEISETFEKKKIDNFSEWRKKAI